jgi:hypothetical protein
MPATVEICESNGASETVTHNISNSNMGNNDSANLSPASYPITPGNRSYAKYQRLHVTNMGGSTSIQNIKVWRTGSLGGSATHVTNARTSGYSAISYATPTASAITGVNQPMPTSTPSSANLGISGSLTGQLTSAGYSDYLVHQIVTDSGDTAGSTTTLNFQYDEIA